MQYIEKNNNSSIVITGCGIVSSIGQEKSSFISALLDGVNSFDIMKRPGRQHNSKFIGAEFKDITELEKLNLKNIRRMSLSSKVALLALHEAWSEAKLDCDDPKRIGLIVGGSNFQQRELVLKQEQYRENPQFIPPTYGMSFMDSDLCGICTEYFGIKGLAYTIGGASASGQLAIIQGIQAVESGKIDACIIIGALMDLSYLECQALRSLGAMGSDTFAEYPAKACRPFDKDRNGFIYGESCGAIVIERSDSAIKRDLIPYAEISGTFMNMDANRNPNPSFEGEVNVIKGVLENANIKSSEIDYINPHGSGSVIGDEAELKAIQSCNLSHAYINATKSIIGHGLTSAGLVETIAVILQMKYLKLHPTRNLENPIINSMNWVKDKSIDHEIKCALNLSIGFGGINTAMVLKKYR
ncbi:malonyl-ACP decarboxylase [Clostridium beijerinckii]|uniref:beta-ketoacyl synthase N-terminal-like domain-containing protein n=1 Tax=Clostridium beijerinckii TaxID=1520 RepID=UPI0015CDF6F0|nr:beta-ketoacyl synthase N-terminal-like domain-containing protein [Clostridium beijerinckii]NYC72219.1 malonyl-ACP decarboxylase [Clostridium beijerinckii]